MQERLARADNQSFKIVDFKFEFKASIEVQFNIYSVLGFTYSNCKHQRKNSTFTKHWTATAAGRLWLCKNGNTGDKNKEGGGRGGVVEEVCNKGRKLKLAQKAAGQDSGKL